MTPVALSGTTAWTRLLRGLRCRVILSCVWRWHFLLQAGGQPVLPMRRQKRPAEAAPPPVQLEEIVVTANKRAEAIQNVPASVLAVPADTLERVNVRTFDDLVDVVPGVTITKTTQPANNSINIRGIGTYAYSIATQPSTVVVVDEIPQAFQAEAFTSLVDVQQVEVLRGPQSTLFGKSASAGAITITTKAPTSTFSAEASAA